MRRTLLPLIALALLLAGAACTGDERADAVPDPASPVRTQAAEAGDDPLVLSGRGRTCASTTGRHLFWQEVRVTRPVVLTEASLVDAREVRLRRAFVTVAPEDAVPSTGLTRGAAPPRRLRQRLDWPDRRRLAGTELRPGETYHWLLQLRVDRPGGWDAVELSWTDDRGRSGDSRLQQRLRTRKTC